MLKLGGSASRTEAVDGAVTKAASRAPKKVATVSLTGAASAAVEMLVPSRLWLVVYVLHMAEASAAAHPCARRRHSKAASASPTAVVEGVKSPGAPRALLVDTCACRTVAVADAEKQAATRARFVAAYAFATERGKTEEAVSRYDTTAVRCRDATLV